MCATCGCGDDGAVITLAGEHHHHHDHGHGHHDHDHPHEHLPATETISLEQKVLAKNDALAEENRKWLAERNILAFNVTSSPGAGKTTLLERTIRELQSRRPVSVIEGDQETLLDAERIRATGCRVVQINTGAGCHLDAEMTHRALETSAARARLAGLHRERRKPGLPRPVRPRRANKSRGDLGDRRCRQAAQVSAYVRGRRTGDHQ